MGDFEPNEGNGGLFKNTRKQVPNAPDMTGNCKIGGTVYHVAGWKRETKKGQPFLSLKFTDEAERRSERPRSRDDDDSSVPF